MWIGLPVEYCWQLKYWSNEMRNKKSAIFLGFGMVFLLYAIFGRYLVLPGYLAGLEAGGGTLDGATQIASPWKVVRYLLWAYSFKLGIYFIILSAVTRTEMPFRRKWAVGIGGFIFIGFAYIPLPEPSSMVFGVVGALMTLLMIYIFMRWARERKNLEPPRRTASDLRMAGTFFFAMATYTLCPLLGVKAFALSPEKMIQYSLQSEAASFAFHLLIELALGWILIGMSYNRNYLERN
jgi:hypothetical protein